MSNIAMHNARTRINLRFKWKNAQHQIRCAFDFMNARAAPRPDRRTDEMHRWNAGAAWSAFQAEIGIGRVDADENRRPRGAQSAFKSAAEPQDFRQMARGFDMTAHGQFLAWKTGLKSRRPHLRAANAKVAAVRRQAHRELPDHGPGE